MAAFPVSALIFIPPFPSAPTGTVQRRGQVAAGPLASWMAPTNPRGWVYGVSCRTCPHASLARREGATERLKTPYSASIAASFSRAGPASLGLSSAKRIVASTSPRCVPQSKRVPSKR